MVHIHPVKALVAPDPVVDADIYGNSYDAATTADRNVTCDECKLNGKAEGQCSCSMCTSNPMVLLSLKSNSGISEHYTITLDNVQDFIDDGLLQPLHGMEESFMIYCQFSGYGKVQIGIFAALDVEDCLANNIRRHEQVTTSADRSMEQPASSNPFTSAYVDPVMVMYRNNDTINTIVQRVLDTEEPIELVDVGGFEFCQPSISPQPYDMKKLTPSLSGNCIDDIRSRSNSSCPSGVRSRSSSSGPSAAPTSRHLVWMIKDKKDMIALQEAFAGIDAMYIADGHHRIAAACKARLENRCNPQSVEYADSTRYVTALIYPDAHLSVLSYNRCVKAIPAGLSTETLLERIATNFSIEEMCPQKQQLKHNAEVKQHIIARGMSSMQSPKALRSNGPTDPSVEMKQFESDQINNSCSNISNSISPAVNTGIAIQEKEEQYSMTSLTTESDSIKYIDSDQPPPLYPSTFEEKHHQSDHLYDICMYLDKCWYRLEPLPEVIKRDEIKNPLSCVDCHILLEYLLNPIFLMNQKSTANFNSMIYVDGRHGMAGIETLVDNKEAAIGFAVGSVSPEVIMRVADASQLLPAKATFFDPKPTPGLFLRIQQ